MKYLLSLLLALTILTLYSAYAEQGWSIVSIGKYIGYCEQFSVDDHKFIVEGDTGFGSECEFTVMTEGVKLGGELFSWDAPGVQASRTIADRWLRINFMQKFGNVVVADLTVEQPKGKIIRVNRMSVSAVSEQEMTIDHEKNHASEEQKKGQSTILDKEERE